MRRIDNELNEKLNTIRSPDSEFAEDDYTDGFSDGISSAMSEILKMPDADVVSVKHGHWIICSDGYYPYCSECHYEPTKGEMTKYCPDCGAKMD